MIKKAGSGQHAMNADTAERAIRAAISAEMLHTKEYSCVDAGQVICWIKRKEMLMKYIINEIPPSNNRFIGRRNSWEYREEKERWAELIILKCRPKPEKPLENVTVRLTYFFRTKGRRDPDNYSGKFILDGLVKAGIIKDDSFDVIELEICGKTDRTNPRTEIEIC